MGFFDSLGKIGDAVGGFFDAIPEPIINIGAGLIQNGVQSGSRDNLADLYRNYEQQNYQNAMNKYNYDLQYAQQMQQYQAGQQASANANAAARAAAARENEARRVAGSKQSQKVYNKGTEKAKGYLMPFHGAGIEVLPQVTQATKGNLSTLQNLQGMLNNPGYLQMMMTPAPAAYQVNVPLPENVKRGFYGK